MRFKESDIEQIVTLFYETVHSVNAQDYTKEQLDAWAPENERNAKLYDWMKSLQQNITCVAKIGGKVVGFSDLTYSGHLDRLYVHKDYQGVGIASSLLNVLEFEAVKLNIPIIDTDASITARPFFEHRDYKLICSQKVRRKGVCLLNYKMTKKMK